MVKRVVLLGVGLPLGLLLTVVIVGVVTAQRQRAARQVEEQRHAEEMKGYQEVRERLHAAGAEAIASMERTRRLLELEGALGAGSITAQEAIELRDLRRRRDREEREAAERAEDERMKRVIRDAIREERSDPKP